jgi:long-chain acyl-CoA synthetase
VNRVVTVAFAQYLQTLLTSPECAMSQRHTLIHQLADWAERTPDAPALFEKIDGDWQQRTFAQYWREVRDVAKGLMALGHGPGDAVAIVGANRMNWLICELAIMAAGGVPAPIYVTNTAEQMAHIVSNAECDIAIADSDELVQRLKSAVGADGHRAQQFVAMVDGVSEDAMNIDALKAAGAGIEDAALDARIDALADGDIALLIYTSGTTGVAKGVQLDHGGLVAVQTSLMKRLFVFRQEPYRMVSYLPLCHAAEQLLTTVGSLATGGQVHFCADMTEIAATLRDVRPTIFLGVPRVWEKFEAVLQARLSQTGGVKGALARWARNREYAAFEKLVKTGAGDDGFGRRMANKLVIGRIKHQLGLDELRIAVTGSAPIGVSTLSFFASLGIEILEAYGMSETTGVCHITTPGTPRQGTVGTPLDGVGLRIAGDGEIELRGRTMTRGYLKMPDKTAELYTDDGWLRTGDIGEEDAEGNLRITGRKKELIITAGGKNVAPAELESYIQTIKGVGQAIAVGDLKPFIAALITLDPEALPELATELGHSGASMAELAATDALAEYLNTHIEAACNAKVARVQQVKKFAVLPEELSIEHDEVTPTMKVRRSVVHERHAAVIAGLYESAITWPS